MSKSGYVEFCSSEIAKAFLKAAMSASSSEMALSDGSHKVTVQFALTKLNGQRNFAFRTALDRIKQHSAAQGKPLIDDWKKRCISVDNNIAFQQSKEGTGGTFFEPFSTLSVE